jgi:hypothetical protein
LNQLKRMTDDTGILQHAIFDLPNYHEGYTTDDNARALLLTLLLSRIYRENGTSNELSELSARYLAFLWYAFDEKRGRFHNFMGFNRSWLDEIGSEDSSCRAIWSLGAVLGQSEDENLIGAAARLFHQALPAVLDFSSPRAWSYALLGIHEYLQRYPGDRAALSTGRSLAWRLADLYRDTCGPGWYWFEDTVSYDNAVLPRALYLFSQKLADPEIHQISLDALHWLLEVQSGPDGCFCPIGSQGFYQRGGTRARFDQQPIEACATIAACLDVYRSTGEAFWLQEAERAFSWFLGRNDLGLSLYDVHTGGCRDGLHPERMNHNQGAESTLAFLTSLAEMHLVQASLVPSHGVRHLSQALSAPPALGD